MNNFKIDFYIKIQIARNRDTFRKLMRIREKCTRYRIKKIALINCIERNVSSRYNFILKNGSR